MIVFRIDLFKRIFLSALSIKHRALGTKGKEKGKSPVEVGLRRDFENSASEVNSDTKDPHYILATLEHLKHLIF